MMSSSKNMEAGRAILLAGMLSSIAVTILSAILFLPLVLVLDAVSVSGRVKLIVMLAEISISISSWIYAFAKLYKYFHYGRRLDNYEYVQEEDH
jgi:uncharacterized membrane protein